MQVTNKQIISNTTMNTAIASPALDMQQLYGVAIQATWAGIPTGTFKLQVSCDAATSYNSGNGPGANPITNWTDMTGSEYPVTAAGDYTWNVFEAMYTWIRLVYTDTSGGTSTAVLNVRYSAKGA